MQMNAKQYLRYTVCVCVYYDGWHSSECDVNEHGNMEL